ncbi:protein kinase domain-containing protein [Anoxynatronum sibiricum]|uniref:Protein kinase n=1 Tax=Anoxynatronum sibiricum TaxID=210623 RepID=A0ABU9VSW7_9CLOT
MTAQQVCLGCMTPRQEGEACPVCGWVHGTPAESHMHLSPGAMLQGKYLIGKALGQGGFGVTYLGWDVNLKLKLAIKEYMPQDLASRAVGASEVTVYTSSLEDQYQYGLEKFLLEAQTLAQFEGHPNIVSVRDFFQANGTAYIAMSYIEGMTLKEYVKSQNNRLPVDRTLQIILPVLDALKEVHQVGILHRDISPDNVFITTKGQVILIDFGAARQAIGEKGRSLSVVLKPGYTPEEQYRSQGKQGPWTDLYAVGAMIYRIICGQMPPESLDRLEEDTLVPPSQLGVDITLQQEAAILKAMAVRAPNRYQTVEDFQQELLGHLEADPVTGMSRPSAVPSQSVAGETAGAAPAFKPASTAPAKPATSPKMIFMAVGAGVVILVAALALFTGGGDKPAVGEAPAAPPSAAVQEGQGEQEGQQAAEGTSGGNSEAAANTETPPGVVETGTFEYRDGSYTGEHVNQQPHGQGTWEGPDGEVYTGFWEDGLPHGEGALTGPDGDVYSGSWVKGNREGYGDYLSANGVRYVGEWANNRRNGMGTETWPNGAEYSGSWKNDLRDGQGTYTWANGDQYVGAWRDGFQHGEGRLTYADGNTLEGNWVNNEFQE